MATVKTKELTERAIDKYDGTRGASLAPLLPQLVDILGVDFEIETKKAYKNNEASFQYFNFWKIEITPKRKHLEVAAYPANAVSRKLTKSYNELGQLTTEMTKTFTRTLSRPSQYMDLINRLSKIARSHSSIYHQDLQAGKNIAFLLNIIFESIMHYTYQEEKEVKLTGWGSFFLGNRAKGSRAEGALKTMQFRPPQRVNL